MPPIDISNAQWGSQFNNTVTGAVFTSLGTAVAPIEVLEDAILAYNKAEKAFNNSRTAPPYLNSVSDPSTGTIIFGTDGMPLQPVTYSISLLRAFGPPKSTTQTSPIII